MELSVLIILIYYNRPNTVRNAYHSLCNMEYENWKLVVIDDGSTPPGKEVMLQNMQGFVDRIKYYYISDTLETKMKQGGSRHGTYINQAIKDHETDLVVILCDDDAMYKQGLKHINGYYQCNPEQMYGYSHVVEYNPEKQWYADAVLRDTWHNRLKVPTFGSCILDSSQVSFRRRCFTRGNIWFPTNMTAALDAEIFQQMGDKYGKACYTNGILQYKGVFSDQMGNRRGSVEHMYTPRDRVPNTVKTLD